VITCGKNELQNETIFTLSNSGKSNFTICFTIAGAFCFHLVGISLHASSKIGVLFPYEVDFVHDSIIDLNFLYIIHVIND
jgi:hypothetical protein